MQTNQSIKSLSDDFVRKNASAHLGANIRRFMWTSYLGEPQHNSLGGLTYLRPTEGKVVANDDTFTLIKTSNNKFLSIKTDLLTQPVSIGDKIGLSFYQIRRFDGTMADGSEDAAVGYAKTYMLTGAQTMFPVKWDDRYLAINEKFAQDYTSIQNPYLRDMITQIEGIPVNNGLRKVVNVLVDAGSKNLSFNDTSEDDDIIGNPPGIHVDIDNQKFSGHVEINYDRAGDVYRIVLTPTGQDATIIDDVHFDELGQQLIEAIDDGQWIKAKVTIIKAAPKARLSKVELPCEA